MTKELDITELLDEFVKISKEGYVPTFEVECKLMLQASEEIKRLRKSLEFQIKLADDYNKSRLHYQDEVIACSNLYERLCKQADINVENSFICVKCREYGHCNIKEKTPNCFNLDRYKFDDMVDSEVKKFYE